MATTGLAGFPADYLSALGRGMAVGVVAVGATVDEATTVGAGLLADAGLHAVRPGASMAEPAVDFTVLHAAAASTVAAVVASTEVAVAMVAADTGNRHPIRSSLVG
jgi:hypothetical protein